MLIRTAVGFIFASAAASIRWRVSGVDGTWSETTSAVASNSSSGRKRTPSSLLDVRVGTHRIEVDDLGGEGAGARGDLAADPAQARSDRWFCRRSRTTSDAAPIAATRRAGARCRLRAVACRARGPAGKRARRRRCSCRPGRSRRGCRARGRRRGRCCRSRRPGAGSAAAGLPAAMTSSVTCVVATSTKSALGRRSATGSPSRRKRSRIPQELALG